MDLYRRFQQLPGSADADLLPGAFGEIEQYYNEPGRHYHNLEHIEQLLLFSEKFSREIQNRTVVDLAIFYHDIIYQAGRNDNEIQSAAKASDALQLLKVSPVIIDSVSQYILATKDHFSTETDDIDLKYFLDFDLAILSAEPGKYQHYASQIRQEYATIPDLFYNTGRLSFLKRAMLLPHLYFTEEFRLLESKAKANLQWEIHLLEKG